MAAIRIANCSGFFGDRLSAAQEMVAGGPLDVLTGDWLAELTMLILAKTEQRSGRGYAATFLRQMEDVMGACLDRSIKVVSNAGGLAPARCAEALQELADKLGLNPRIAVVQGDDLRDRLVELREAGVDLAHMETGVPLGDRTVLTANAYLGGWGIAEALDRGADIVVTGRVTDAALVVGPAAWHHRWVRTDWDQLAGAVVAGHVIECGAQVTGGNYAFFDEVPGLVHPGFPVAVVEADGSSTITKQPGQGGMVTVGTVTAQLLYEIGAPAYPNPDVTARFETIALIQSGPDEVRISGVKGGPPPETLKVAINYEGGWRTTTSVYLTGLDIEKKAAAFEEALWSAVPGGRESFDETAVVLVGQEVVDPADNDAALVELRIVVKAASEREVGRALTSKITELGLSTYPGFFAGPTTTQAYGVYWPASVPAALVPAVVRFEGIERHVDSAAPPGGDRTEETPADGTSLPAMLSGETRRMPLGTLAGARSGDKGGNANVGVWVRTDAAYTWLASYLTTDRLRHLLPEARGREVRRYELPGLRAVNFVLVGLLGEGVASSTRVDGQAKGLGEYLRAKHVDLPISLLPNGKVPV